MNPKNHKQEWIVKDTVALLYVYKHLDEAYRKESNPFIIALAEKLGRTPYAILARLIDLRSSDPEMENDPKMFRQQDTKNDRDVWMAYGSKRDQARTKKLFDLLGVPLSSASQGSPESVK